MARYLLDPQDRLDHQFDFAEKFLRDAETIAAFTVVASTGVTVASSSQASGIVTVWLHQGVLDATSTVTCHVTTSTGRQKDKSFTVQVKQR